MMSGFDRENFDLCCEFQADIVTLRLNFFKKNQTSGSKTA